MWWGKTVTQISDKTSTISPQFPSQLKTLKTVSVEKGAPFQFIYAHIFPSSTTRIRASSPRLTWSQQRYLAVHPRGCSGEVSRDTLLIPVTVPPHLGWASVLPCLNWKGGTSAGVAVRLEMEEAGMVRGRVREPRAFRGRTCSIEGISGGVLRVASDNLWPWALVHYGVLSPEFFLFPAWSTGPKPGFLQQFCRICTSQNLPFGGRALRSFFHAASSVCGVKSPEYQ